MLENVTFDSFMDLDSKSRKAIINDPECLKELVKKNISEKRYLHSLSVADTCVLLAKANKVDVKKAYVAGILHDCCKYLSSEELKSYLTYYDPKILEYPEPTYHGFVAKYYLKEKMNFHDKEILNAIYNHTICTSYDKLSMILYIADKREPLRNIQDNILEIAQVNLKKAYLLLEKDVEAYVRGNNEQFVEHRL